MLTLPIAAVTAYSGIMPSAIVGRCGHCHRSEIFRPGAWANHANIRYSSGQCPNCTTWIFFAISGFNKDTERLGGGQLHMHPADVQWLMTPEIEAALKPHPEILSDYLLALQAFNNRDPIGIVLSTRRLLEGMAMYFVPPEKYKDRLASDLASLKEHHDLSSVIFEMSEAINAAGTLGAHIGASRLNDDIATECFVLASDFMRLHFVMESKVAKLKDAVKEAKARPIGI